MYQEFMQEACLNYLIAFASIHIINPNYLYRFGNNYFFIFDLL